MSAHTEFLIAAVASLLLTAPFVVAALWWRLVHRWLAVALYVCGYALIAQQFVVDEFVNPPLFFHGFGPGIGIGLLLTCFGLLTQGALARRDMGRP